MHPHRLNATGKEKKLTARIVTVARLNNLFLLIHLDELRNA